MPSPPFPVGWNWAVQIDAALRDKGSIVTQGFRQELFVHRSCVPLNVIDLMKALASLSLKTFSPAFVAMKEGLLLPDRHPAKALHASRPEDFPTFFINAMYVSETGYGFMRGGRKSPGRSVREEYMNMWLLYLPLARIGEPIHSATVGSQAVACNSRQA